MIDGTDDSIGKQLMEWRRTLDGIEDDVGFLDAWGRVLEWLKEPMVVESLLNNGGPANFAHYDQILALCQRRYLTLSELQVARQLKGSGGHGGSARDTLSSSFGRATYDRVEEALTLVDFGACRRFVMVGCGPFPAAVLLDHDRTNVPELIGLDCDSSAVQLASRLARGFATPRVSILECNGDTFDFHGCDTIYVANHVVGKRAVLDRIAETAPAGARVLLRDPCGLGWLLSERGAADLPPAFSLSGTGEDNAHFHSIHVVLNLQ